MQICATCHLLKRNACYQSLCITITFLSALTWYVPPTFQLLKHVCWISFAYLATCLHVSPDSSLSRFPQMPIAAVPCLAVVVQPTKQPGQHSIRRCC